MKQLVMFTITSLKLYFRSREAVLWNFIFPIALFILYVTVFSRMYPDIFSYEQTISDNLAKILSITIMSGGLFSLAISVSVMKEKGILRRYKVTPVRPITIVTGIVIRQFVFMMTITAALVILALVLYHARISCSIFDVFLITSLGITVFCALGFCIAGITHSNQGAIGVSNLLFMPMMFISGATIPNSLFPKWLIKIADFFPATHINTIYHNSMFLGKSLSESMIGIIVLAAYGIAFIIIAAFVSRWN